MADFDELSPERFIIDVVNFTCDFTDMRECIYRNYYEKGYRDIGSVNLPTSHAMYKVVKKLNPTWISRLISIMSNWSFNTDKFVKGE